MYLKLPAGSFELFVTVYRNRREQMSTLLVCWGSWVSSREGKSGCHPSILMERASYDSERPEQDSLLACGSLRAW